MRGRGRDGKVLRGHLHNNAVLLRAAIREVEAVTRTSTDTPARLARSSLTRARLRLDRAAFPPLAIRRSGGLPSVPVETVCAGIAAVVAAIAAYVFSRLVRLPDVVTVVVFVLVVIAAEWMLRAALNWLVPRIGYLALPYDWPLMKFDVDIFGSADLDRSLAAIALTRESIGLTVATRLSAIGGLPPTGAGLLGASNRDVLVHHLRLADLYLCQGYDALERWREGAHGADRNP